MVHRSRLERVSMWLRAHPFGVDAAGTALFLLFLLATGGAFSVTEWLLQLGLVVPLAWRRRAPVASATVVLVFCLLTVALDSVGLPGTLAPLVSVYSLAAYSPRWASRAGFGAGILGAALAAVRTSADSATALVLGAGVFGVCVLAAWALGDLRRARLRELSSYAERARMLEVEREQERQLAAGDERARIAREMHDVVAHSLSVIIAQADGGRYAGHNDPAAAAGALAAIGTTGRQALTDMRGLLGVLRTSDDGAFTPQPDVAAIDDLVGDVRASGLVVELHVVGAVRTIPTGAQLAAYRIVQESLTNVLKHAGPAGRARVELGWDPDGLAITVTDDGRGAGAPVPKGERGHGILGMRERAELHGGSLAAGPVHTGGFRVRAELPYGANSV